MSQKVTGQHWNTSSEHVQQLWAEGCATTFPLHLASNVRTSTKPITPLVVVTLVVLSN